jgi:hypothetical protein
VAIPLIYHLHFIDPFFLHPLTSLAGIPTSHMLGAQPYREDLRRPRSFGVSNAQPGWAGPPLEPPVLEKANDMADFEWDLQ